MAATATTVRMAPTTPTHRTQPGVGEIATVAPKATAKNSTSATRSTTTVPKACKHRPRRLAGEPH